MMMQEAELLTLYMTVNRQESAGVSASSSLIQMTSLRPQEPATSSRASSEISLTAADWFTAVAYNDLRTVEYFLSRGSDVNARCWVIG